MLFNTVEFILFFLLIISTLIIIKNRKFQHLLLLAGSFFFYYYSSNYLVTLLIFSTLLDFYIGQMIANNHTLNRKKLLLGISLAGNLGILGFFKYADFGIGQFNDMLLSLGYSGEIPFLELA